MSTDKERFKRLCLEILPLINGIMDAVKRNGYESMSRLSMGEDEYFAFGINETGWSMTRLDGGYTKIHYEYSEEIQLSENNACNNVSENLVEISLAYAELKGDHKGLNDIDSITWKQMFMDWANEFEAVQARTDWKQEDYLESIGKFARQRILEFAGLEG